jgi:hypothetical protein
MTAIADPTETETAPSPFHAGEKAVHARLGVCDIEDFARKVVRPYMPEQHRAFYRSLPFVVAAARDAEGRPWATMLEGPEGFIAAPDDRTLAIDAAPPAGDPLEAVLTAGADIGLLGIALATRRRNRVNGRIAAAMGRGLRFTVGQSFGNCPQYIRERAWTRDPASRPGAARRSERLDASQRAWIANADTFFVATGHDGDGAAYGMDASHRGGERGFVEVLDDRRIRFPDYAGNNHFNTIGNMLADPRAGYLFVDFATGGFLQVSGAAAIDWDSPEVARFPGARRLVTLTVEAVVEIPNAVSLRWDEDAGSVRSLRLVGKTPESADVTSFALEARDGGPLADFEAGQHLTVEVADPDTGETLTRSYSLSSGPGDPRYRISVKREPAGRASRILHDRIETGAILSSRAPAGGMVLPHGGAPVVLISAGVGVTPMMSMLRAVAADGGGRPVLFVHGARDAAHHPFRDEVNALANAAGTVRVETRYSRPGDGMPGGRIDRAFLAGLDIAADARIFICGPDGFMAAVQDDLERLGVDPRRIHTESFGPKG